MFLCISNRWQGITCFLTVFCHLFADMIIFGYTTIYIYGMHIYMCVCLKLPWWFFGPWLFLDFWIQIYTLHSFSGYHIESMPTKPLNLWYMLRRMLDPPHRCLVSDSISVANWQDDVWYSPLFSVRFRANPQPTRSTVMYTKRGCSLALWVETA